MSFADSQIAQNEQIRLTIKEIRSIRTPTISVKAPDGSLWLMKVHEFNHLRIKIKRAEIDTGWSYKASDNKYYEIDSDGKLPETPKALDFNLEQLMELL